MMFKKTLVALVLPILLPAMVMSGSLAAQTTKTYIAEYRAYNDALERGEILEAIARAEAAWRAAETELGDSDTTAKLAYNFAASVYDVDPNRAIEPLQRVIQLTGAQHQMFGAETPELMLVLSKFTASGEPGSVRKELSEKLNANRTAGIAPSRLSARGWLALSKYYLTRKNHTQSIRHADQSIEDFEKMGVEKDREFAGVLILGGIARTSHRSRTVDKISDAVLYFDRAIEMFPPQKTIAEIDQLLGVAMAWHGVALAIAASDYRTRHRDVHKKTDDVLGESAGLLTWVNPRPDNEVCNFEWEERPIPEYPNKALSKGNIAAVIIGYNVGLNGKPIDQRIVAEVPFASDFGKESLKVVGDWQLKSGFNKSEACRNNLLSSFKFVIR